MNKGLKIFLFIIALGVLTLSRQPVKAQCAVCAANVASNVNDGGKAANGLDHGILYLMAAPYLVVGILAVVWYKKYRRKNVDLNMHNEKLHLN